MGPRSESVLFGDERTPPDDATRVAMFLDAAADYTDLRKALPLPKKFPVLGLERPQYWTLMLHAAVLRKFFADPHLKFSAVLGSVRRLIVQVDPDMMRDLRDLKDLTDAKSVPAPLALNISGHDVTQWEVVQIELYGRHLHMDYSKWEASKPLRDGRYDVHVGEWCAAAAFILEVTEMKIRSYADAGFIDLTVPPTES